MMKERMMAILIGGLMLFSVAGFALTGIGRFAGDGGQQVQIPTVMNEYLSNEQMSQILRSGRVLIRNVYTTDCYDCVSKDATLEIFANTFSGNIVLEEVMIEPDNTTIVGEDGYVKFEMISPTGDIVDLKGKELTQESLTDIFCDISAVQPRECLLRDIASQQHVNETNQSDVNDTMGDGLNNTGMNNSAGSELNDTAINDSNASV